MSQFQVDQEVSDRKRKAGIHTLLLTFFIIYVYKFKEKYVRFIIFASLRLPLTALGPPLHPMDVSACVRHGVLLVEQRALQLVPVHRPLCSNLIWVQTAQNKKGSTA
jgi:hypothetical protein